MIPIEEQRIDARDLYRAGLELTAALAGWATKEPDADPVDDARELVYGTEALRAIKAKATGPNDLCNQWDCGKLLNRLGNIAWKYRLHLVSWRDGHVAGRGSFELTDKPITERGRRSIRIDYDWRVPAKQEACEVAHA